MIFYSSLNFKKIFKYYQLIKNAAFDSIRLIKDTLCKQLKAYTTKVLIKYHIIQIGFLPILTIGFGI